MPGPSPNLYVVRLFGRWEVRNGKRVVERLKTRKAESLFAYLACHLDGVHPREVLLEMFWPDSPPSRARQSLSQALSAIRLSLEFSRLRTVLLANQRDVTLEPGLLDCDVRTYRAAVETASGSPDLSDVSRAVELYRGDFMPGYYDDWVLELRDHLRQVQLTCLQSLAKQALMQDDPASAARHARKALELDPLDEVLGRVLIESLLESDQEAAAVRAYESLRRNLDRELGEEPEEETQLLFERVRHLLDRVQSSSRLRDREVSKDPGVGSASPPGSASATNEEPEIRNEPRDGELRPTALPSYSTSFVGRDAEMEAIRNALTRESRSLISLVGLGGVGKTRLAVEFVGSIEDGAILFVDLSQSFNAADLIRQLGRLFGLDAEDATVGSVTEALRRWAMESRPAKLLLDNFEQMEPEATVFVSDLVSSCDGLHVLVTSRRTLESRLEKVIRIPPLELAPAVRLFLDRVAEIHGGSEPSTEDVTVAESIVRRLDGVPLALELAAARSGVLSLRQLESRLSRQLELLQSRRPDVPERHRAMATALDWSVRLLPAELRLFLRDLTVFRASWTVHAASHTCRTPLALDWLEILHDASLLVRAGVIDGGDSEPRFRFYEVVREFLEAAVPAGRKRSLLDRKLRYLAAHVEANRRDVHGPNRERHLGWFRAQLDDIRDVLSWSERFLLREERSRRSVATRVLEMCGQLGNYWRFAGLHAEGAEWNRRLLEAGEALAGAREVAAARWTRGYLLLVGGRDVEAEMAFAEALTVQRRRRDTPGQADTLLMMGQIQFRRADYPLAKSTLSEAQALFQRLEQGHGHAAALAGLADVESRMGEYESARENLSRALAIRKAGEESWEVASCYNSLGLLDLELGNYDVAEKAFLEAASYRREVGDDLSLGTTLYNLSVTTGRAGKWEKGLRYSRESLDIHLRVGHSSAVGHDLAQMAELLWAGSQLDAAFIVTTLAQEWITKHSIVLTETAGKSFAAVFEELQAAGSAKQRSTWRARALTVSARELLPTIDSLLK